MRKIFTLIMMCSYSLPAWAQSASTAPPPLEQVLVQMLGQAQLALAKAAALNEQLTEQVQQQQAEIVQLMAENKRLSGGRKGPASVATGE